MQPRQIAHRGYGFLRMPVGAVRTKLRDVTPSSYHVLVLIALTVVAGLLMVSACVGKKQLSWKSDSRRCSTCGRTRNYDCPCRR